jgi:FkbM family methyltransferase
MVNRFVNSLLGLVNLRLISLKHRLPLFDKPASVLGLNFDHVISRYLLNHADDPDFNFIQIGAYDGIMHDPLRKYLEKYKWSGIMVEPQPRPFSKLQDLYSNRREIKLLNFVVSASPGQKQMYIVDDTTCLPEWLKGSASFYKHHLLKFEDQFPILRHHIKEINVKSITVDQLLQINGSKLIHLLQIDAEGYDAEILRLFPFNKAKPVIIRFECKNLSKNELEDILTMLVGFGYQIAYDGGQNMAEDILAVLK